jgi:hypothetical protein
MFYPFEDWLTHSTKNGVLHLTICKPGTLKIQNKKFFDLATTKTF